MSSWQAQVVDHLCFSKQMGVEFEEAWRSALLAYPPRSRDVPRTLFDPDGPRAETLMQAFKRFADDAWHNRHPELRAFGQGLEIGVDGTRGAHGRGHLRSVA